MLLLYSNIYKEVAESVLSKKYGLDRLNKRCLDNGFIIKKENNEDSKIFSLFNTAYVERLTNEQLKIIENFIRDDCYDNFDKLVDLVIDTYHLVLGVTDNEKYFLIMNGYGELIEDTIIITFEDDKEYDDEGFYIQPNEYRKINMFINMKKQFEELVYQKTGDRICLIRI